MAKRLIIVLSAMAALLAVIGIVKFRQLHAEILQTSSFQPPPEAVTTVVARQESWRPVLSAIGSVAAVNGVTVSADLPGIVESIGFDSGRAVRSGDALVRLDARPELAQLVAAEARRDLDRLNLDRARGLLNERVVSQADYDAAVAAHDQSQAAVGEIRVTIERKSVRAPFSGILGIRRVNLGQYLKSGDPVVSLQSIDPIYVNFSVPQQDLAKVRAGGEIRVATGETRGVEREGKITAIDSIVDESTRNVQVQATLANPGARLRPGMFVNVKVVLDTKSPVVPLPGSAISYAPYGDSVYIVEDLKGPDGKTYRGVRQQFVKLGGARGDQVAVLSGVKPGEEVVSSGGFKLRNGAAVLVNNEVRPSNDPAPRPEDN